MDYKKILEQYAASSSNIMEALHAVQDEYSYLPEEAIIEAAKVFGVPTAVVYSVATYYSMFSIKERGKNVIRICESAPCHIEGAAELVAALEAELGIEMGESTPDGRFALEYAQCVGQCQGTPVFTINRKPYLNVKPESVPGILDEYR
ncbi:MAG TPA: NAD(P)H-dependent oxidoreductase subunit E [Clostridiaceae bacterium]|nr:NAD(P)H-dependent oxidoreductase subunit E [Clostridiaceae bacterium]